jgi:segregation and condensation protein B
MPLDILLEGLLFYKAAPLRKKSICEQFAVEPAGLEAALNALRARLEGGALRLLETEGEIQLVTAPDLAPFLEEIRKAELKKDIGKAGAETLAIILYKRSASRTDIDRIRGVNSSFILRNLLVRGLVDRAPATVGGGYVFSPSVSLLALLGVTRAEELTDFARITDALEQFSTEQEKESSENATP